MTLLLAIVAGTFSGILLSLVPGLSVVLVLMGLVALGVQDVLGGLNTACFIAAAVGGASYSKHLGFILNPSVASGNPAALDPAIRLVSDGRGRDALRLMTHATDIAWIPASLLGFACLLGALIGMDLVRTLDGALGVLGIPLILYWVWTISISSARPVLTAIGFTLTGLFGYAVLHMPALTGSQHQLAPILSGLFGIPIAVAALRAQSKFYGLGSSTKMEAQSLLAITGALIGTATGFFAGLGAGSLAAMTASLTERDEDYVLLATAGEASNDFTALLLVVAAGMGRSGEAVLLGRIANQPGAGAILCIIMAMLFGAWFSRKAVAQLAREYEVLIKLVPAKCWASLVLGLTLVPVLLAGGLTLQGQATAIMITLTGVSLAAWMRMNFLPNQVALGAIALPLVLQSAGLVPVLNGILFG